MPDQYETKCPLCDAPRPRNAKRCMCNYTFEYERESRPFVRVNAGPARAGAFQWIVLVIAIIAGAVAFSLIQAQTPGPKGAGMGILMLAISVFAIAGAFFNWGFFMRSGRAGRFVALFGHAGARIFYAVIGGALGGVGVAMWLADT